MPTPVANFSYALQSINDLSTNQSDPTTYPSVTTFPPRRPSQRLRSLHTRFQKTILFQHTSMHKTQGTTLPCVSLAPDSSIFSVDQAYVALSRCRKWENVQIMSL